MRIENLTSQRLAAKTRVAAKIIWEDCDRPPFEMYFETTGPAASDLESNPQAYLVAGFVPAMHFGEKRIHIAADICPEMLNGLETNMRWLQHWSDHQLRPLRIECTRSRADLSTRAVRRAGSFLSGGIDSLATLRTNRLDFPLDHSASIRDCIMVYGFDIGGGAQIDHEEAFFDRSVTALREIAQDAQVDLIPFKTNVRLLHNDVSFWMSYFCGAALAAVAHALSHRLSRVYIGSSFNIPALPVSSSHPLLDSNYGSHALQIIHQGLDLTRLEKVRRVADWDVALRNLRVCTLNPDTGLNCGICEKCVRTMLELLAVGKLNAAESFPTQHIDPDLLETIKIRDDYVAVWYEELLAPLAASGHHAIAERIQGKLAAYEKLRAWEQEEDWKGAVKRLDRKYLRGTLSRSWVNLHPHIVRVARKGERP